MMKCFICKLERNSGFLKVYNTTGGSVIVMIMFEHIVHQFVERLG